MRTNGCIFGFSFSLLCALGLVSAPLTSHAGLYAYQGYAIMSTGAGNTYYDTDFDTGNANFTDQNFTITYGQVLRLGGQVTSDAGNGQPAANGPDWAKMFYKIDNGSFSSIDLSPKDDFGTSGWKVQFEQAQFANMAQIGSGLSVGSHTLQVYFQTHDNTQPADAWVNAGGLNYTANLNVTAVPEPAHYGLICAGGLLGLVTIQTWRKRKTA